MLELSGYLVENSGVKQMHCHIMVACDDDAMNGSEFQIFLAGLHARRAVVKDDDMSARPNFYTTRPHPVMEDQSSNDGGALTGKSHRY